MAFFDGRYDCSLTHLEGEMFQSLQERVTYLQMTQEFAESLKKAEGGEYTFGFNLILTIYFSIRLILATKMCHGGNKLSQQNLLKSAAEESLKRKIRDVMRFQHIGGRSEASSLCEGTEREPSPRSELEAIEVAAEPLPWEDAAAADREARARETLVAEGSERDVPVDDPRYGLASAACGELLKLILEGASGPLSEEEKRLLDVFYQGIDEKGQEDALNMNWMAWTAGDYGGLPEEYVSYIRDTWFPREG